MYGFATLCHKNHKGPGRFITNVNPHVTYASCDWLIVKYAFFGILDSRIVIFGKVRPLYNKGLILKAQPGQMKNRRKNKIMGKFQVFSHWSLGNHWSVGYARAHDPGLRFAPALRYAPRARA